MASNRKWCVYFTLPPLSSDLRVVELPSARRRIATIWRRWMPACPLIARKTRLAVESPPLSLRPAYQRLCVPGERPPCSRRHVVRLPTLLLFAATDDAEARREHFCVRC